jgi:hypothetical protein
MFLRMSQAGEAIGSFVAADEEVGLNGDDRGQGAADYDDAHTVGQRFALNVECIGSGTG